MRSRSVSSWSFTALGFCTAAERSFFARCDEFGQRLQRLRQRGVIDERAHKCIALRIRSEGEKHYPGWSVPVSQYRYLTRGVTATGHETTDTDPGIATSRGDYSLESWILHHGHQIEMLANLDRVPEAGSLVMVTFGKPRGGSGFPARVVAIVP
jgi:kynurenine formamidase